MTAVLFLSVDGQEYVRKYFPEMRSTPQRGDYVDFGDNIRRHVAEVYHDLDPKNVPVRCYVAFGDPPS